MSRKTQIALLGLLTFLIVCLLGLNFALSRYSAFWQKGGKIAPSPSPVSLGLTPTPFTPPPFLQSVDFASPVEKTYLNQVKFVELNLGQKDLGFALPEGSPVYAVASGGVDVVKDKDLNLVILSLPQGGYFKYFFTGTAIVEKGSMVQKGEGLGKTGKGFLNMATGKENLILSLFKSQMEGVSLDQGFVGKFK